MNRQWIYRERPTDKVALTHFEWREAALPVAGPGEVLVRVQMLSVDPSQRIWMAGPSYRPMLVPGTVMACYGVGEVVASKAPGFAPGDRVEGDLGWQDYAALPAQALRKRDPARSIEQLVGALGITGTTAWIGLFEVGRPSPGETVLVSGAAGAVGSIALQAAVLAGCRVVGVAGGAAKCGRLIAMGAHAAVDYKAGALRADLRAACPDGIDLFFDNTAGDVLEAALPSMNVGGRIVCCGAVSVYDQARAPAGPRGVPALLIARRLRMEGFVVLDHAQRLPAAESALARWLDEGRIVAPTHVVQGLAQAPQALLDLLAGLNVGKMMVRVEQPPGA
ncbi:NADP-dependent oxidoreductase [Variovorax sp. dw_954]|uniref:NADP-dependent oxidoreductase n=1 Tax=Variovorax sp. dw_954 TaxID=2720078 RepID=UPI001BD260E9|nr:NADP-dependent oxidoreductase [Variovorax sp. dw_954]